jgi:hypothetical protein
MLQAVELARSWRTLPSPTPEAERTVLVARVMVGAFYMVGYAGWATVGAIAGETLAVARESGDPAAIIDALVVGLQIEIMTRDGRQPDDLRAAAREALQLATDLDDPGRLSWVQSALAMIEAREDPAAAEVWMEGATEAARRSGNPSALAGTLQMRGRVASLTDRQLEAQRWFRGAQAQYEAMGDTRFAMSAQSELAHALRRSGAIDEAEAEYRQSILGWQRTGNRGAVANQLESLAFTAQARGDGPRAARLFGAAEALRESAGDPMTDIERVEYEAEVDRLRGLLDLETFSDAWAEGRRLTSEAAVAFAVSG